MSIKELQTINDKEESKIHSDTVMWNRGPVDVKLLSHEHRGPGVTVSKQDDYRK